MQCKSRQYVGLAIKEQFTQKKAQKPAITLLDGSGGDL